MLKCLFFLTILLHRILANYASCTEDKQRFLLDGLRLIQHTVTEQEDVVLNTQSLLLSQEEVNIIYQCHNAHQKTLRDISSFK